ncbi:MAG: hypothetical protein QM757_36350 [Paludibaculum sp.]
MPDLYHAQKRALFERGTLILGGRKYTLAVLAQPRAAHAALTSQGTTCILYVNVTPKDGGPGYEVAVPVTGGRSADLEVGKRGVFYDVDAKEFDATVTQVIRQSVSLWEAMTMPFQRIGAFISSKVEASPPAGTSSSRASWSRAMRRRRRSPPPPPPRLLRARRGSRAQCRHRGPRRRGRHRVRRRGLGAGLHRGPGEGAHPGGCHLGGHHHRGHRHAASGALRMAEAAQAQPRAAPRGLWLGAQ